LATNTTPQHLAALQDKLVRSCLPTDSFDGEAADGRSPSEHAHVVELRGRLNELMQEQSWIFELMEHMQDSQKAEWQAPVKFSAAFAALQSHAIGKLSTSIAGTISLDHLLSSLENGLIDQVPAKWGEFTALVQRLMDGSFDVPGKKVFSV
jgi:hypothetical protein